MISFATVINKSGACNRLLCVVSSGDTAFCFPCGTKKCAARNRRDGLVEHRVVTKYNRRRAGLAMYPNRLLSVLLVQVVNWNLTIPVDTYITGWFRR